MASGLEDAELVGEISHLPLPHLPHDAPVQDHRDNGRRGRDGAVQGGKPQGGEEAEQIHGGRRVGHNLITSTALDDGVLGLQPPA